MISGHSFGGKLRTTQITTPAPIGALGDPLFKAETSRRCALLRSAIPCVVKVSDLIFAIPLSASLAGSYRVGPIPFTILMVYLCFIIQVIDLRPGLVHFFSAESVLLLFFAVAAVVISHPCVNSLSVFLVVHFAKRIGAFFAGVLETVFRFRQQRKAVSRNKVFTLRAPLQTSLKWQTLLACTARGVKVLISQGTFSVDENVLRSGSFENSNSFAGRFVF